MTDFATPGDWDRNGTVDLVARDAAGALHLYSGDQQQIGSGWTGFRLAE